MSGNPSQETLEAQLRQAQTLLSQAQRAVALTGAGISTPSGIPDFRSAAAGLWRQVDPYLTATIQVFWERPQAFYDWVRPLAQRILEATPNPAHLALAQLEKYGPLQALITQNIDDLHFRAGSRRVFEVHGHLRQATCQQCGSVHSSEETLRQFVATGRMPRCELCGGVLKPNVVLFGEDLPARVYQAALTAVRRCDLLLVAGSSLEVAPVSDLPVIAKHHDARLIIVNQEPTPLDELADVVIRADVVTALPRLAQPFLPDQAARADR